MDVRCFIYELATENIFSLWPSMNEMEDQPPRLQLIVWSPLIKSTDTKLSSHSNNTTTVNVKGIHHLNENLTSSKSVVCLFILFCRIQSNKCFRAIFANNYPWNWKWIFKAGYSVCLRKWHILQGHNTREFNHLPYNFVRYISITIYS